MRHLVTAALLTLLCACANAGTQNHRVEPTDAQLHCETDADCDVANLACATCGDPVAKAFAEQLRAETERRCADYTGPMIKCAAPRAPVCNAHRCAMSSNHAREKE
jgi:hypothetical protein